MKIYIIADHTVSNKTILQTAKKWEEQGHAVKVDMYYDPIKADWCDMVFGEYIQGGVIPLMQSGLNKPIFIRGIDIDLYYGHYLPLDLNKATGLLFICDYMKDYVVGRWESSNAKKIEIPIHVNHLGVDLKEFTYKERKPGKTIGWINNFWSGKGIQLLCQMILRLSKDEYKFEIVGKGTEPWVDQYFKNFIEANNLQDNVKRIQYVESVNDWMEGIDYLLSTSLKECMSLPIAEAMAKGIKPVIHNWWGADQLYPKELCSYSLDGMIDIVKEEKYDSIFYRKHIEDNYDLDKQVDKLNKIIGL